MWLKNLVRRPMVRPVGTRNPPRSHLQNRGRARLCKRPTSDVTRNVCPVPHSRCLVWARSVVVAALSNEANLRGLAAGWMVFGVSDSKSVVGTTFLTDAAERQILKHQVHQSIDQRLTIREIFEVAQNDKRVLLLEIPAGPRGIPISWKGTYYARAGESLVSMPLDKLDAIREQTREMDWTAAVVPEARIDHLDPEAIKRAREGFSERHSMRGHHANIGTHSWLKR